MQTHPVATRGNESRRNHSNRKRSSEGEVQRASGSHISAVRGRQRPVQQEDLTTLIAAYLQDHEGGNHSPKTLEWHRTALGLMRGYLERERMLSHIDEVQDQHISGWFTHMRKTKAANGKIRCERTIQTYARSARAFFHWLEHRGLLEENPFDRVDFPKVGRPLIQTITAEEFEALLAACVPPKEAGPFTERAAARNRAILWVLYDAGIRVSELIHLRCDDLDRKRGVITVLGKGSKERRIALGQNCLRHLLYYLDKHRPQLKGIICLELSRAKGLTRISETDTSIALRLVDDAERFVGQKSSDDFYTQILLDGDLKGLNTGRAYLGRAKTLLAVGRPGKAKELLEDIEDLKESDGVGRNHVRRHAWIDILHAQASLGLGDYYAASYSALEAFKECKEIHSVANIARINDIYMQLLTSSSKDGKDVKELGKALRLYYQGQEGIKL